jgi:large subunit ribosomal protein MRP49
MIWECSVDLQLLRMFWRNMLPRLKYHNPAVPMTVNRTADHAGPSTLSIFLSSNPSSTTASTPSPDSLTGTSSDTTSTPLLASAAEVLTIDMKHKSEDDILNEFLEVTGAATVDPKPDELESLRDLEEQKERSARDSERSMAVRTQWKKEQAMLAAARGELA